MRDPTTRRARDAKRKSGIYYTPADVAEYMATSVLADHLFPERLRILDPSCGTGVYFVALLNTVCRQRHNDARFDRLAFAARCLYGFDISTLAIESSAFVLLCHCMPDVRRGGISPWAAWHALRLNLTATDALKLQAVGGTGLYADAAQDRQSIRDRLLDPSGGLISPQTQNLPASGRKGTLFDLAAADEGFPSLGALFPEAGEGFDVLIGNPPYADLGPRSDYAALRQEYKSLRGEKQMTGNIYPLFIEMMWRMTRSSGSTSALVVPLSISYHQGEQYRACRQAMLSFGGRWRCAFFDREPHALFGEDVKTRNAILFRTERTDAPPRGKQAIIETGALRKWTSRTRDKLFSSINFTPLPRVNAVEGLPKLSGHDQARVFSMLAARTDNLRTLCSRCRTCRPYEATLPAEMPRVFVASTAYNFLNVFRSLTVEPDRGYPLSENTVHSLEFAHEETADLAFAVLSSRLTFWLWHVQGDGFHVAAWFIHNLPFGRSSFTAEQARALHKAAWALWTALQSHRIVSVNRGKQTIAYRPLACDDERDAIDDILLDAACLPKTFKPTLRDFVKKIVLVDGADKRRDHLKSLFDSQENAS